MKNAYKVLSLAIAVMLLMAAFAQPTSKSAAAPAAAAGVVWRVNAQGRITKNGVVFPYRGGNWFGLEGRHEPSSDSINPSGAPMEQYLGNTFWATNHSRTIAQTMNEIKALGINVIRLPLSPQTLTGTDPQGMAPNLKNHSSVLIPNSRLALETMIKAADAVDIQILLDIHSCSNYLGWRAGRIDARPPYVDKGRENYDFERENASCAATNNPAGVTIIQAYDEAKWLADLKTLAGLDTALGVDNIIGIDIFNEPWDYTWQDWKTLSEKAYTAINAVNPNILIFVEGISDSANNQDGVAGKVIVPHGDLSTAPNWGENLYEAGANLPNIPQNRLVFSPHTYGPSVFVQPMFMDPAQPQCAGLSGDAAGDAKCNIVINPTILRAGWQEHFGYLKDMGYAVVIGEFGGNMGWPNKANLRDQARYSYITDRTVDEQWQNAFVDWMISKGIEGTYWSINPESGDTGGIYDTTYDPVSNASGWGEWTTMNTKKVTLLKRLWNSTDITPTPTPTGPTPTPSKTFTPTITNTPSPTPTNPVGCGAAPLPACDSLKVQLAGGGTDNTQQTAFKFTVKNTSTSAKSNISVRLYFTTDASNAASAYVLEKYYDQSGVATISGPTLASGSTYYFTVSYGTASLAAGASWEFQTGMHLSSWGSTYNAANDWWHGISTLPAAYTDWALVPAYISGSLVWGSTPGGDPITVTPSPTVVTVTPSPTVVTVTPSPTVVTITPSITPTRPTNTPTITNTPTHVTITPTFTKTNTPTPTKTFTPSPTIGIGTCRVTYSNANDWGNGFTANVTITNTSTVALSSWKLTWSFAGNQTLTNLWNGTFTQTGSTVSVSNLSYNGNIPANGGTATFGFNANYSGSNLNPSSFSLNGVPCQ